MFPYENLDGSTDARLMVQLHIIQNNFIHTQTTTIFGTITYEYHSWRYEYHSWRYEYHSWRYSNYLILTCPIYFKTRRFSNQYSS
jgi:hypothetical protein